MGFLSSFLSLLKDSANRDNDKTQCSNKVSADDSEQPSAPEPEKTYSRPPLDEKKVDAYFNEIIIESEFPGYTIERNVRPISLDANAHPSCYPITYLFRRDGKPVLAVLVIRINQYKAMIAKGTYEVLNRFGIPYIRFFKEYRNDKEYVINRIKENL